MANTAEKIESVDLVNVLKDDYLSYSLAVLNGRALPDLYDGLKPVQRRLLQVMSQERLSPDGKFVKCARVTGLTMAYLHPHSSSYGALVNMSTSWNNNVTWINGHGNFGSSVDAPASERYTECKLTEAAMDLLLQDSSCWDTKDNYDGSRQEAVRFCSAVPTVLLNGDSGIAVGYATKLAPHSLESVIKALEIFDKSTEKIAEVLIPDFPTGCDIVDDDQLQQYKKTGQGNIRCRAKMTVGTQKLSSRSKERPTLTFTNLPPGVNPERLGEQIKSCLDRGVVTEGVTEIIDESDLSGDRITVIGKVDSRADRLSQQLYEYTDLDSHYAARTLVIDSLKPEQLSAAEIVQKWARCRLAVLGRKFAQELEIAKNRHEIVCGLLKAIEKLDLVIKKIRAAKTKTEAMAALMGGVLRLTRAQAEAVLEMRLRQLTNLDQEIFLKEREELEKNILSLQKLFSCELSRKKFMLHQAKQLLKKHGTPRKSQLVQLAVEPKEKVQRSVPFVAKPKFIKIDAKRGLIEQVKGPRGAIVLEKSDKLVCLTENGFLKKVPYNYKGAIANEYSPVLLAKKESEVLSRKYIALYYHDDLIRSMVISGEDLCKATSKGKLWLPEGATALYLGESPRLIVWQSVRKKPTEVDFTAKPGKPGSRGHKLGAYADVKAITGLGKGVKPV